MITSLSQRWRGGRASYRPPRDCMDASAYEVAPIDGRGADTIARAFVQAHHYSGSMPAARERIGLYRARHAWAVGGGELVGIAVFSHPPTDKVLSCLPCPKDAAVELGRFVLLDNVEHNGESWFLARCFDLLRQRGYEGVVSFSDPVPRRSAAGTVVFPGHIGGIYQASNAVFAGRATGRSLRLLPDGRVFNERSRSKIRQRERGWQGAVEQLVAVGAAPPERTSSAADLHEWLLRELPLVTRCLVHPGNLRYLFGLTPAVKRRLPESLPYPKIMR